MPINYQHKIRDYARHLIVDRGETRLKIYADKYWMHFVYDHPIAGQLRHVLCTYSVEKKQWHEFYQWVTNCRK